MMEGRFGENDELIFEIELMTKNGEIISVDVMLDTGFTAGYLAIDQQDIIALGWQKLQSDIRMKTAQGVGRFDIYEGQVIIDSREFIVPVHVGKDLPEILIGVKWLKLMRLSVDYQLGILTLASSARSPTTDPVGQRGILRQAQ